MNTDSTKNTDNTKDTDNKHYIEYKYLKIWVFSIIVISIIMVLCGFFVGYSGISFRPINGPRLKDFTPAYPPPLFNFMNE